MMPSSSSTITVPLPIRAVLSPVSILASLPRFSALVAQQRGLATFPTRRVIGVPVAHAPRSPFLEKILNRFDITHSGFPQPGRRPHEHRPIGRRESRQLRPNDIPRLYVPRSRRRPEPRESRRHEVRNPFGPAPHRTYHHESTSRMSLSCERASVARASTLLIAWRQWDYFNSP